MDGSALIAIIRESIERAMAQLRATDPDRLLDERKIGRAGLPATVIGALVHGAEHTARHAGQLVSTVKLLQSPS